MEQLYFSEEHKMLRDMVREFAQNEVKPIAREIDASGRFPSEVIKKMANLGLMGIPWEEKYGNTTAASVPIALCEALDEGRIKKGDIVVFAAFGSGFTWASAILKW